MTDGLQTKLEGSSASLQKVVLKVKWGEAEEFNRE